MAIELSANEVKRLKRAFASIVSGKTHLSVLSSVLLEPVDEGVRATVTNLEERLSIRLEGSVAHPILFPWEDFKSLATRVSNKGEVRIFTGVREVGVEIKGNGMPVCYRIASEDPGEFPEAPSEQYSETIRIAGCDFSTALRKAIVAASTDHTRFVLNSVLFDGPNQRIVGTDGRRLICAGLPRFDCKAQAILPATKFLRRNALLKEDVVLSIGETHCRIESDDCSYVAKLVDGSYPNWELVVPAESALPMVIGLCDDSKVNTDVLASLPNAESVIFYADDAKCWLIAPDGRGGFVHGVLPHARCEAAGDVTLVSLNPAFLKDALAAGFSKIRVGEDTAPMKFCSPAGDFSILMPMRNVDVEPVLSYIEKVSKSTPKARSATPEPLSVLPPLSQPTKEKSVMSNPAEAVNAPEAENQDPLEQLLALISETRADMRVVNQSLRQIQSLARDVDRARKKEHRDHQAVVDIVDRLKNLAA